ncbi:hypothetical protein ACSDR0_18950 [Streptosporangium sp. G11]|uniref:hypothetical protein n=1 Tax=Streptosporangium sp. G11 TaxID=3436926 RepID=UPI003EB6E5FF
MVAIRHERAPVTAENLSPERLKVDMAAGCLMRSSLILRFRGHDEMEAGLVANGYQVPDVREAPGRPGREFVFVTERTT